MSLFYSFYSFLFFFLLIISLTIIYYVIIAYVIIAYVIISFIVISFIVISFVVISLIVLSLIFVAEVIHFLILQRCGFVAVPLGGHLAIPFQNLRKVGSETGVDLAGPSDTCTKQQFGQYQ